MSSESNCPRVIPVVLVVALALGSSFLACDSRPPQGATESDAARGDRVRSEAAGVAPRFVPYDVTPELENGAEVENRLQELYPDSLEQAGVGGSVVLWLMVDERGEVQEGLLQASSGHAVLDQAAGRIAGDMRFSPALNRGEPVGVWVQQRIRFEPDTAETGEG